MRRLIILFAILPLMFSFAAAENAFYWDVVRAGTYEPVDTIFIGGTYDFQISIANDIPLGGFNFTFEFDSPDGLNLSWNDSVLITYPGSRLVYPVPALNLTGLDYALFDADGLLPDRINMGGAGTNNLQPGPAEPMFGLRFKPLLPDNWEVGIIGELCIDTGWIPPAFSQNIFVDEYGSSFHPNIPEPTCWPVKMICGNANGDQFVNVGDGSYLIYYIFKDGPPPFPLIMGDENGDSFVNVADIVYLINYIHKGGPPPVCQ